MLTKTATSVCLLVATLAIGNSIGHASEKIPLLYSTDLHHPHMDPDDHFDLATLFSLAEFDVQGIVLDCGAHQLKAPGAIPVRQMLHLTGRQVPTAVGLGQPLRSASDDALDQDQQFQQGVQLILDVLRRSGQKVTLFTTGSVRDVAAAFNREPELLRSKIARLYINIGNMPKGQDTLEREYNVNLDRQAFVGILQSGLPVYWCPCFDGGVRERGRHGTFWKFEQRQVLETAPAQLQNWFIYALTKPPGVDPIAFLKMPQDSASRAKVWPMSRNMWCTAPFLHAAGRQIYARSDSDFVALRPEQAARPGGNGRGVDVFTFVPTRVAATTDKERAVRVSIDTAAREPNGFLFQVNSPDYDKILASCLKNLLMDLTH